MYFLWEFFNVKFCSSASKQRKENRPKKTSKDLRRLWYVHSWRHERMRNMLCRGFDKSWWLLVYHRLGDLLSPSVWPTSRLLCLVFAFKPFSGHNRPVHDWPRHMEKVIRNPWLVMCTTIFSLYFLTHSLFWRECFKSLLIASHYLQDNDESTSGFMELIEFNKAIPKTTKLEISWMIFFI